MESDWKLFKPLRQAALERYCARALDEAGRIPGDGSKPAPQRFDEALRLLEKRERELGPIFDHLRRSTAIQQLIAFRANELLSEEEVRHLSEDIRGIFRTALGNPPS